MLLKDVEKSLMMLKTKSKNSSIGNLPLSSRVLVIFVALCMVFGSKIAHCFSVFSSDSRLMHIESQSNQLGRIALSQRPQIDFFGKPKAFRNFILHNTNPESDDEMEEEYEEDADEEQEEDEE